MIKIGLSGVMGAGKTSVIQILKEMGIPVFDCDAINRELLMKGNAGYRSLAAHFGSQILDENQEIDKQVLSDRMFDHGEREQVEQILHPLIKEELLVRMNACKQPLVVAEVPLLFEIGWQDVFDETWVVACEEEILLRRLKEGRQIDKKEALRRLSAQLSQKEKIALCDVVLYNNFDRETLRKQVAAKIKSAGEKMDESRG